MLYEVARPASSPASFAVHDGPPIDYRFIDDLREFISRRLDKVNPYKESQEYCLQQEKASRLFEEIKGMLPEEGQELLAEYGDALGAAHYLEVEILGERAFLDGISPTSAFQTPRSSNINGLRDRLVTMEPLATKT